MPAARALLQVARSRLAVGEYDAALTTARRSADLGLAADDPELELGSLSLLSSVLIHSCRGRSLEAKGLLGRAAQLATDLGDLASESDIERELGFVLWIEGNLAAAEASFARSIAIADGIGDGERAAQAETYLGACANDRCDLGRAGAVLGSAIERFERAGSRPWLGYAEAMHARVHLRSGQPDRGRRLAELAVQRCRDPAATAFLPWALIAFGECALALDDPTAAHDAGVQALTFATEFGDPSVEVLARRLLALVRRARGDELGAIADLERAAADAARSDDVSAWARASTLTDLVELQRDPDEDAIAGALGIATEGPMPDLVARLRAVRRERQTVLQTAPS